MGIKKKKKKRERETKLYTGKECNLMCIGVEEWIEHSRDVNFKVLEQSIRQRGSSIILVQPAKSLHLSVHSWFCDNILHAIQCAYSLVNLLPGTFADWGKGCAACVEIETNIKRWRCKTDNLVEACAGYNRVVFFYVFPWVYGWKVL